MALLFADEDFSYPVVDYLRQLGHDVLTAQTAGQAGLSTPDAAILARATTDSRAVLTFNRRDFIRLHSHSASHCGIIVCTRDHDTQALAKRIDQAITGLSTLDRQLIRVYRPGS
jgi:hypothetical protein